MYRRRALIQKRIEFIRQYSETKHFDVSEEASEFAFKTIEKMLLSETYHNLKLMNEEYLIEVYYSIAKDFETC